MNIFLVVKLSFFKYLLCMFGKLRLESTVSVNAQLLPQLFLSLFNFEPLFIQLLTYAFIIIALNFILLGQFTLDSLWLKLTLDLGFYLFEVVLFPFQEFLIPFDYIFGLSGVVVFALVNLRLKRVALLFENLLPQFFLLAGLMNAFMVHIDMSLG